eukprot:437405-Alexandrium_andersonii.AAC.1
MGQLRMAAGEPLGSLDLAELFDLRSHGARTKCSTQAMLVSVEGERVSERTTKQFNRDSTFHPPLRPTPSLS